MRVGVRIVLVVSALAIVVQARLLGSESQDHALRTIVERRVSVSGDIAGIEIPVDGSIDQLVVEIQSPPAVSVTVLRPGGTRAGETDRDVRVSNLTVMAWSGRFPRTCASTPSSIPRQACGRSRWQVRPARAARSPW